MSPSRQLVSVVVPTHDRPRQLRRALASVAAQTYPHWELIVVDDGSTPPVELPGDLHDDPRVRLLRVEPARGVAAARNRALELARGELVAFLDDDDAWRPTKLAHQVQLLQQLPGNFAGVECGFDRWEGSRRVERYVPRPHRDLPRDLLVSPFPLPSTLVVRRAAVDRVGRFDETLVRGSDWEFAMRLADRYEVAALPAVLVDRDTSRLDPARIEASRAEILRRLEPRLARLAPADRARVRAQHTFTTGMLLAVQGRRREARRVLVRAWRLHPRSLRPLLHLPRTVVGERLWRAVRVATKALVQRLRHPGEVNRAFVLHRRRAAAARNGDR